MIFAFVAAAATLTVRGDRIYVSARINGMPTEAVLDSAAETTIIDDDFARKLGTAKGRAALARGSGGMADAELIANVGIEVAGLTLPDETIGVVDLDDIGRRLFGRRLNAIVGRELFDAARLAIDIEARTIEAIPRTTRPRGTRLSLRPNRGIETISIRVNGEPTRAEFDLGNGSDMLIGRDFARRAGLLGGTRKTERGGGIGGEIERRVIILKSVRLAGLRFRNVRAAIDEQPDAADANVGVKLLRLFRIVTDFPQRAVWLQPRRDVRGAPNG